MTLRIIEWGSPAYDSMIQLRMNVLLRPIGIPEHYIRRADEKKDILIGAFHGLELVGCCILSTKATEVVQLRQMVVDAPWQGKKVGTAILHFAETTAREKGFKILFLHARKNVVGFYEKSNYQLRGKEFFEVNISHFRMEKQL